MRWMFGLVALLLAAAATLMLSAKKTASDVQAVRRALPSLREGVAAVPFDEAQARRLTARLTEMLDDASLPEDELREAAATAAGWAAGATPGTNPYHAAVSLRGAADELRASRSPGDAHRGRARQLLESASLALSGATGMPGGPAGGVRDQLQNLQYSQQEKLREIEGEPR
ncbi:MAG: hypothetical protein ACOY3Y_05490 [Acidobacteriota bacterium]